MFTLFASKRVTTFALRTPIAVVQKCNFSNGPDKLKEKAAGDEKAYFSS